MHHVSDPFDSCISPMLQCSSPAQSHPLGRHHISLSSISVQCLWTVSLVNITRDKVIHLVGSQDTTIMLMSAINLVLLRKQILAVDGSVLIECIQDKSVKDDPIVCQRELVAGRHIKLQVFVSLSSIHMYTGVWNQYGFHAGSQGPSHQLVLLYLGKQQQHKWRLIWLD